MDIKDFQGLTKFKIIIPVCYIINWILMVIGPIFYQSLYTYICIFFLTLVNVKVAFTVIVMLIITIKSNRIFNKITMNSSSINTTNVPLTKNPNKQKQTNKQNKQLINAINPINQSILNRAKSITYGFIIPNYKQDIDILTETLNLLASHKRSQQQYIIFLAMEAHQPGSQSKAHQLLHRFQNKFKAIDYTLHTIRQNQQKGKASNVSWCAQHLQPFFTKYTINPDNLMLTIIDADSWAPDIYFDILQQQLINNYQQRHKQFYQPPQIFTRNNLDVPVFTRVYDIMHSFIHCSNLFSIFNVTFPLSNYTLSYNLAKRIGFWDTCADAIGEDFHTLQKAFWKTNGQVRAVPIYTPFNQVNISTGNKYLENVKARFWQAERHSQGVADIAWQFKMLFTRKLTLRNLLVFYQIFQNGILPAFLPWICISLSLQNNILYRGINQPANNYSTIYFYLFNCLSIFNSIAYLLFERFKRKANNLIYHRQNQSIFRLAEYLILVPVNVFSISVPTFIISAFGSFFTNRQYIVAEKKIQK